MKASEFYKNQLSSELNSSHDNKFNHGKNLYSDLQADCIITKIAKTISSDSSVLELGTFTGRITKKLEKHFYNITLSEVDKNLLSTNSYSKLSIDLSMPVVINKKFDLVVSLGHQVSFSNNTKQAIKNIANFTKQDGITIFDIWNKRDVLFRNNKPSFEIERITKEGCVIECRKNNLEIIEIYYGPRLNNTFGKYSNYFIKKIVRRGNLCAKTYIYLEKLFSKTNSRFLEKLTQSIIITARKI